MKVLASAVAAVLGVLVALPAVADAQEAPPAPPTAEAPAAEAPVDPGADPAAEEAPPEPPMDDPSPAVAVVLAQLEVLDVQKVLAAAESSFASAKGSEARAQAKRDAATRDLDEKRSKLTGAVADAYVRGGIDTNNVADATASEYLPVESARLLAGSAIDRNHELVQDAEARATEAETALAVAVGRTAAASAALDAARTAMVGADTAVADARRLTNRKDVSPTVLGESVLTAEELVGWYKAQGIPGYVALVDLPTLAAYYIEEGAAEGVRGDVAFAQSIIETGSFTSPLTTHNNFAGIGACDSCPTGFDFPTPQKGVRAQAQLLHAYADRTLRISTLANPAVGSNPDNLSVRGCCTTWNKLTGTWATDTNYGPKIMTVYLSMLQYALQQRTLTAVTPAAPPPLPNLG